MSGADPLPAAARAFDPLSGGERRLLDACRRGETADLGADIPEAPADSTRVRADFVRFLLLCKDAEVGVHEHGVALRGAWLEGALDLAFAEIGRRLSLFGCRLDQVDALHARLRFLNLGGCRIDGGFVGDGLRCQGHFFLRDGTRVTGGVRLLGATVEGDLDLSCACLENPGLEALSCDRLSVAGKVSISHDRDRGPEAGTFTAVGTVSFDGARVGGDFDCSGASLKAPGATALSCVRLQVAGRFILQDVAGIEGGIDLTLTEAGSLCDDSESWKGAAGALTLDGFTYSRLAGRSPTDAGRRIAWLKSQIPAHLGVEFRPQPWEQVIAVLRAMGHPNEARSVAVSMQDQLRTSGRVLRGTRLLHAFYGLAVGYGYRPLRLLVSAAVIWLACGAAYWAATNPALLGRRDHLLAPAKQEAGAPPPDYRTFVPLVYSADVLLPVVDLGYQQAWRPVVRRGERFGWGQALLFLYWFEIAFGWIASVLLVAVLGALIKKD